MRACLAWLLLAAMQCFHLQEAVCADTAEKASAPAFNARQLVSLPTDGWIANGGNIFNQRYSPLRQIDRDNVAKLKAEWRASLRGTPPPVLFVTASTAKVARTVGRPSRPR